MTFAWWRAMHVYRTAGRTPEERPLPGPSARTLWAPLGRGALCLVAALVPPVLFNQVLTPLVLPSDATLLPTFDFLQDGIAAAMLASVVVLLVAVWRRVRPVWRALRLPTKIAYVVGLVAVQLALTAGAEAALLESRGGWKLFGPTLARTAIGHDGQMAFVYRDSFLTCRYDVQSSAPLSPVMRPAFSLTRATCSEPVPDVEFGPDGVVGLVGADGKRLEAETPAPFFSFWHGC